MPCFVQVRWKGRGVHQWPARYPCGRWVPQRKGQDGVLWGCQVTCYASGGLCIKEKEREPMVTVDVTVYWVWAGLCSFDIIRPVIVWGLKGDLNWLCHINYWISCLPWTLKNFGSSNETNTSTILHIWTNVKILHISKNVIGTSIYCGNLHRTKI